MCLPNVKKTRHIFLGCGSEGMSAQALAIPWQKVQAISKAYSGLGSPDP